jgi:ribosomal protein L37E
MLSTYCQECGSKNEYRFSKPKFCSNCGHPLSGEERAKPKQKVPPRKTQAERIESDFDEEGTEIYEVPDLSRLEYEIESSADSSFSLGSLFKNIDLGSTDDDAPKRRGRPRKNAKK